MSRSSLPVPAPSIDPETEPFWTAAHNDRLVLRRCLDCRSVVWFPRTICPQCWSANGEWFEASGEGVVYSHTLNTRGEGVYRDVGSYVLAYVELAEGPRVLTNIIGDRLTEVRVGSPVVVVFDHGDDGSATLIRFRLA